MDDSSLMLSFLSGMLIILSAGVVRGKEDCWAALGNCGICIFSGLRNFLIYRRQLYFLKEERKVPSSRKKSGGQFFQGTRFDRIYRPSQSSNQC